MPEVDNTLPPIQPPTEPEQPPTIGEQVPGEPEGYTELDDTYAKIAEETAVPPGTTADGQPAHPELPTTNAYEGGGLPLNPREPYPVGSPPEAKSYAQINGRG